MKKRKTRKKMGKKGFTLVEIMIVVAIIGLLAAIALPNLLRARVNSNDNAIQSDLRAFSTGMESYRAAQNPPEYPQLLTDLTGANPAYLDATWTAGAIKHGHTLAYLVAADPAQTYSMTGAFRNSEANNTYCIDHTGVLRVGTNANAATGCNVANVPVQQ